MILKTKNKHKYAQTRSINAQEVVQTIFLVYIDRCNDNVCLFRGA